MSRIEQPPDRYFPNTSWTLLVEARGSTPQARHAQAEFARRYYRPVRDYLGALSGDRQEAEELAQGFFADVIAPGRLMAAANRSRGSFRHYLKQSLRNYVASDMRFRQRQKRHALEELRPDAWSDEGWDRLDLRAEDAPDKAFHNAWVRALLGDALSRVHAICTQRKQTEHYELFVGMYLCDAPEPPSWRELGAAFGLDEKAARSKTETVARHFRAVLREMMAQDVGGKESVDEEIAALLALL